MTNTNTKGIVNIHGKSYMTVARRLELAHEDKVIKGIKTEVLQFEPVVVVRVTVMINEVEYQGVSSANPAKSIEKSNPFEVAETSAVGRALGFAGYGLVESVATADDMVRATRPPVREEDGLTYEPAEESASGKACATCGAAAEEKSGFTKAGNKPYHGIFCTTKDKSHTQWLNN